MNVSLRTACGAVLAAALLAGCSGGTGDAAESRRPAPLTAIRLVAYSGCADMLAELRERTARHVGPWGLGGPPMPLAVEDGGLAATAKTAERAAPEHSTTNVHEAGVDEPDLVKTDGRRIVTVDRGVLRVVDAASKRVTGTLRLVPPDQVAEPADLLLHGDRALVLFGGGGGVIPFGATAKIAPVAGPRYVLVDLSAAPKLVGSLTAKGSHLDARMVGSTARIVVRSQPEIAFPEPGPDAGEQELLRRNREAVRGAPLEAWQPAYEVTGADGVSRTGRVACERISRPAEYTGTSLLTVHTVDLAGSFDAVAPVGVAADGDTVYATATSLYVTSNPNWWSRPMPVDLIAEPVAEPTGGPGNDPDMPSLLPDPTGSATAPSPDAEPSPQPTPQSPPERTEVHRFDISGPGEPRYAASGGVPGRLLNQYSLSEHAGHLRVATTSGDAFAGAGAPPSASGVYVLQADTLAQVGAVTGLGKGERIYAVRFLGPVGYVVTFRQVDPLYTLDLRDPAAPRVTGELKITGYSAYLHPAGEGRLLGIGQEASTEGRTLGTQVSLFDVSDPADPTRLARFFQRESGSEAEWDPHAFLYWPADGLAVLPVSDWRLNRTGALVLKVGESGITVAGRIEHPRGRTDVAAGVQRSLIVGDELWTLSAAGLKASDRATLADRGWIPFE